MRKPCRRCRRPSKTSICEDCLKAQERARPSRQDRGYDAEFDRNSALIRAEAGRVWGSGGVVACVVCGRAIPGPGDLTIEHRRAVRDGGTNALPNLGPAHARCNYGWRRRGTP